MISKLTYPRAAVIGNPSDGYKGKTISFPFDNFYSKVNLFPSKEIVVQDEFLTTVSFNNVEHLVAEVINGGYEKEEFVNCKIVLAAIKVFFDEVKNCNLTHQSFTFKLTFSSTIPRSVGLAGSSAIIIGTLKALMAFCNIKIPIIRLAHLALNTETEELKIGAGLQDRIVQSFARPYDMDFNGIPTNKDGGVFKPIEKLENLNWFIAYSTQISENSGVVHNDLRQRYLDKNVQVHNAMERYRILVDEFKFALKKGNLESLNQIINENYDLRKSIISIHPQFDQIINLARSLNASSKCTGSGGAIIGLFKNEKHFNLLSIEMSKKGIEIIKPNIVVHESN